MLEDLAILTGARALTEDLGVRLENVTLADLGRAKRARITRDTTTLVEGQGKAADIQARVHQLRNQIAETTSDYDREKQEQRLARLAGGVAVVRVGASTETELKEKKARVEDALHATHAAIAEGILPGGGVALLRARAMLGDLAGANPDQTAGVKIVLSAVEEPLRQIAANAGAEPALVINRVLEGKDDFGFNALNNTYGPLLPMGVLDPCKVTRIALQNAASVAALLLTVECMIAHQPEERRPAQPLPEDELP
jgi:chaperonin GroEL